MKEIVQRCKEMDTRARDMYVTFAGKAQDPSAKKYWKRIAADEVEHIRFWQKMVELAEAKGLPSLFEDEHATLEEIESVSRKIEALLKEGEEPQDTQRAVLLSFYMEITLLHPVLNQLFQFWNIVMKDDPVYNAYGEHLERVLSGPPGEWKLSSEIRLLGDSIRSLWSMLRKVSLLSYVDELTGVLNRRGLFFAMTTMGNFAKRNQSHVAVMMIDIDHFKQFNDLQGHPRGDEVLRETGQMISTCTRKSDVVGRYGGEEFTVFTPQTSMNHALALAEKIRAAVEKAGNKTCKVTVSIGVASGLLQEDVEGEMDALIRRADQCLYLAKKEGRNRVVGLMNT